MAKQVKESKQKIEADGTITLDDGSRIDFHDIERIEW